MQPFLVWAGGKQRYADALRARLPVTFTTYFEPFVGGGALFFALQPRRAVLADRNPDLIATYQALQAEPVAVATAALALLTTHDPEQYYAQRALCPADLAPVAAAARFIYLNRTCFNGLWRVNRRGRFNVPIGNVRMITMEALVACGRALEGVMLLHADAFAVLERWPQAGDAVYLDPPYLASSATANFAAYTSGGWSVADDQRLAALVQQLTARGVACVVSAALPSAPHYAWAARVERVMASRLIAARGSARGPVEELVITTRPRAIEEVA